MSAALRAVLRAPVVQNAIQQTTKRSVTGPGFTYGPPKVRISLAEKAVSCAVIIAGVLAGPVYISLNLDKYRGLKE